MDGYAAGSGAYRDPGRAGRVTTMATTMTTTIESSPASFGFGSGAARCTECDHSLCSFDACVMSGVVLCCRLRGRGKGRRERERECVCVCVCRGCDALPPSRRIDCKREDSALSPHTHIYIYIYIYIPEQRPDDGGCEAAAAAAAAAAARIPKPLAEL